MEHRIQKQGEFEVFDVLKTDGSAAVPEAYVQDEGLYRFVAYTSPYLFWLVVIGLTAGVLAF